MAGAGSTAAAERAGRLGVGLTGEWQAGRVKCIHMLDAYVLGAPGDWQMIATTANGQPAAVVYHRDTDGRSGPTASWCWPQPPPVSPA